MRRAEVIRRLRQNRSGLLELGVSRLALYGSTARDNARRDSDVDVVVDAPDGRALGLFRLARVAEELGRRVDVISRAGLDHAVELRTRVAGDLIDVF
jgi:uncharacterized protein